MKISLKDGLYSLYEFEAAPNHNLATRDMALYLRSQRKVTEAQIANAEVAKSVGIPLAAQRKQNRRRKRRQPILYNYDLKCLPQTKCLGIYHSTTQPKW